MIDIYKDYLYHYLDFNYLYKNDRKRDIIIINIILKYLNDYEYNNKDKKKLKHFINHYIINNNNDLDMLLNSILLLKNRNEEYNGKSFSFYGIETDHIEYLKNQLNIRKNRLNMEGIFYEKYIEKEKEKNKFSIFIYTPLAFYIDKNYNLKLTNCYKIQINNDKKIFDIFFEYNENIKFERLNNLCHKFNKSNFNIKNKEKIEIFNIIKKICKNYGSLGINSITYEKWNNDWICFYLENIYDDWKSFIITDKNLINKLEK